MTRYGIGQSIQRAEDDRFLTGRGVFMDDINRFNQVYAAILYSPHAHAKITSIKTEKARNSQGVVAVLTGVDVDSDGLGPIKPRSMPEDMGGPKGYRTERPILALEYVRFVGDRVALVLAETQNQAEEAVSLIDVDYELLPASIDTRDTIKSNAPKVYAEAPNNTSFEMQIGDTESTARAFEVADHITRLSLKHPRLTANSIEARGAIGEFDKAADKFTLTTGTQAPFLVRSELARFVFNIPESNIRVVTPDVGGGFGMRTTPYPEDALVLWAAKKLDRPVKWISTRAEALLSDDQGRDQVIDAELALTREGKITGLRCLALHNVGAYIVGSGANPSIHFGKLFPSVYNISNVDIKWKLVFTHTAPTTPYRGAGRPEAIYAIERLMDKAAIELGLLPDEIRRRNFITSEEIPYTTQTGFVYDSGEFETVMDRCIEIADYQNFENRKEQSKSEGRLRGIGLSYYIEDAGNINERMDLRFDGSGNVTIYSGTCSTGNGHETSFPQLVSEWLGLDIERVRFVQGDTDRVQLGRGTFASRSMVMGGNALKNAAEKIIQKGTSIAAHLLDTDPSEIEFDDGNFKVRSSNKFLSLVEVAQLSFKPMAIPAELGIGLHASGSFEVFQPSFPNGCHICEVEIDKETGATDIVKYTVVDDVGNVINPMMVEGQIHGGIAQGVGEALYEEIIYAHDNGQLLTGSFMDYSMPRADHFSDINNQFHPVPCTSNPIGVKGAGEGGTIGSVPAVTSAIIDALSPLGVEDIHLPATPRRVWSAIQQQENGTGVGLQ